MQSKESADWGSFANETHFDPLTVLLQSESTGEERHYKLHSCEMSSNSWTSLYSL